MTDGFHAELGSPPKSFSKKERAAKRKRDLAALGESDDGPGLVLNVLLVILI